MKRFKAPAIVVLAFVLVAAGFFAAACLCPQAYAQVVNQNSIHADSDCCCSGTLTPMPSSFLTWAVFDQPSLDSKSLSEFLAISRFWVLGVPSTANIRHSSVAPPPSGDLFLKNETLRI
ncbi:MAG: hypothetical protein A3J52_02030 [Omnitrophica bacterium RIFCSPHIGHO2_02_FULL_49_9]|nr:MAG: hypothetical protein A3J52_02030 [Omnitrophica bacterium RIFCSPHIGHO2_02_FULL_49_9]